MMMNIYALMLLVAFQGGCRPIGIQKDKILKFTYISSAHLDSAHKAFTWSSTNVIDTVSINLKERQDTIIFDYGAGQKEKFIKEALTENEGKLVKKKIADFELIGNYDKETPDGVYFLLYKNPSDEIMMQVQNYIGSVLAVIHYSNTKRNSLEKITNYRSYVDSDLPKWRSKH